ncbi:MAG: outer membrane protein assembly factor BamA [Parachlamydiaceae bacterium]|nr:outer membrane protein assembly factor BamA [Parachlamydiaceae bacterium]
MHKKFFLVNSFVFFLLIFFSLNGEILQYENHLIDQVKIVVHANNEETIDRGAISTRLNTQSGGFFSQNIFDEDLKILSQDYSRIEPSVDLQDDKISILIDVWPKPTIASIRWEGNCEIETRYLQKELDINCFTVFEKQAFNTAFQKLKLYYINHGYFESELSYRVEMNCEANEVTIYIQVLEGRCGKIQEIRFVNFTSDEKRDILNEMITKKFNVFMSWYNQEGILNQDALDQDKLTMINELQNRGYLDADVTIDIEPAKKVNRVVVTITANKGEFYRFGKLSFEGNTIVCNEEIDRIFTIRSGYPYSLQDLSETIELITDAYGKLGYIDANVDYDAELVEDCNLYNINFTITEGQQFHVGLIRVFGNLVTKSSVILHETLMIPGEIFNIIKLKATEERLKNIGYFKNVNAYIAKGTESSLGSNYRDIYIEVEETGTGQFSAFLGYSSVEEIFAGINVTENNFNHEGFFYFNRDGIRAFRGGGEFAQLSLQIGQKSREYSFSWTKPYFMDTKWSIGCDLSKTCTRYVSNEYDLETVTLALRASYNINQFVRFGVHYRLKNGDVYLHSHNKGLEKDARVNGLISAIGPSLTYDSTNHPVKPTGGLYSRLFLEYAGLGGSHHFLNMGYENAYYLPVGSRCYLKYRADFRFIQPLGKTRFHTIPIDERIFLGGNYMIRGFRPYHLGPHYKSKKRGIIPEGGISLQYYSVEATRKIMEDFEIYAFLDAGHLSKNTWEFGRMDVAIGYGARIKVIPSIPAVTLGMGYPLNARRRGDVKRFFFSFGGNF